MRILLVLAHQNTSQTSFCHALAQVAVEELAAAGHEVVAHDLYAERFDPVLTQEELSAPAPTDPLVRQHIEDLLAADGYVVIHPNWWGQPPAVLKGWLDRVIRQGAVYRFSENGVASSIAGRKALVLTTSNTPREAEMALYGDPLENLWKNCVFGLCGVTDFARRNFESVIMSSPDDRQQWLDETRNLVRKQFPRSRG